MSDNVFDYVQKTCISILMKSGSDLKQTQYTDDDVRKTHYGKMNGIILSGLLSAYYLNTQLSHQAWWQRHFHPNVSKSGKYAMACYEGQARKNLILSSVATTESSFRSICRVISPGACKNATAEFKSIYEHVLKKTNVKQKNNVLDLSRNIRNAILHNDGIYLNVRIDKVSIEYRSNIFNFEQGTPIRGLTWICACDIVYDLFEIVRELINTEIVSAQKKIVDLQKKMNI